VTDVVKVPTVPVVNSSNVKEVAAVANDWRDSLSAEIVAVQLNKVLQGASSDIWENVDAAIAELKASAPAQAADAPPNETRDAAKLSLAQRDYAEAISQYAAAIVVEPNDTDLLTALGYALMKSKQFAEAEKTLKRSLRLSPDKGAAWANMAEIFAEGDNADASAAALKVAIHLSSNRQKTLDYLADSAPTSDGSKYSLVVQKVLPIANAIPYFRRND
jgi:tetratricopeptide (TPR) repeat protein